MKRILRDLLAMSVGAATVGIVWSTRPDVRKEQESIDTTKPIARAGEWITNPEDGTRVCKLNQDLGWGKTMDVSLCDNWQGPKPSAGQQVPYLRWGPHIGTQIYVEGQWRP